MKACPFTVSTINLDFLPDLRYLFNSAKVEEGLLSKPGPGLCLHDLRSVFLSLSITEFV